MIRRRSERSERSEVDPLSPDWRGEGLIFVGGHARSGTTYLGRLLGAHEAIGYWEEPFLLSLASDLRTRVNQLVTHLQVDARVDTREARRGPNLRDQFGSTIKTDPNQVRLDTDHIVRGVLGQLFADFRSVSGKPRMLDKTPIGVVHFALGLDMLPEAQYVHIVRDPRGVISSLRAWKKGDGEYWVPDERRTDVARMANDWCREVDAGVQAQRVAEPGRMTTITYESLMEEPVAVTESLLEFLRLEMTPEVKTFINEGMGGIDRSPVTRWRDDLTMNQIAEIESVTGRVMQGLGYVPEPD